MSDFRSPVVDRVRLSAGVWKLPGGELLLPKVFGFCGGVRRALTMLDEAVEDCRRVGRRIFLLGQIIHNPYVNRYFLRRGVELLGESDRADLARRVGRDDCAVIPAFGVPPDVHRQLAAIGCRVVDSSCVDVRRLWAWAEHAVSDGYGVLLYGRALHEETVVTTSRLAEAGGRYLIAGDMAMVERFCDLVVCGASDGEFSAAFDGRHTNSPGLAPFDRLAQVSQTTMLYDQTLHVRRLLRAAYRRRFGGRPAGERLLFQPTVCRATQLRQDEAVRLCGSGLDMAIVVGGLGSSNTRHLYELAASIVPAHLIEDAEAVISADELRHLDPAGGSPAVVRGFLPPRRPLRIGVLAGASTPEVVIGEVLERFASLLS